MSGNGYLHQDWNTVVLNKKTFVANQKKDNGAVEAPLKSSTNKQRQAVLSSATAKPAWKIEAQVDDPHKRPIDTVPKDIAKAIVQARVNAKLSQKELATKANMTEREIKDIESAKAVENKAVLAKLKRLLGIA